MNSGTINEQPKLFANDVELLGILTTLDNGQSMKQLSLKMNLKLLDVSFNYIGNNQFFLIKRNGKSKNFKQ